MINFLTRPHLRATYNDYVKELVSRKSVFTDDTGIRLALNYCAATIKRCAPGRRTYFDNAGNLISVSPHFNTAHNAVFLSAHVDTVDANPAEWRSVSNPFLAVETATHIIGRGANDCKAGVALILLSCHLADELPLDNVVLLISYREEGNGAKTSMQIGSDLGGSVPLSATGNVLLCLENTTKLADPCPCIDIYDREPCNVFISLVDEVANVREFLLTNALWKPVFIAPLSGVPEVKPLRSYLGTSGHSSTIANAENMICKAILHNSLSALHGGDPVQTSVIDNRVQIYDTSNPGPHRVILNYRGLTEIETLKSSIAHIRYEEYHPFLYAAGSDRREDLERSPIKALIRAMTNEHVETRFVANPGRSDASAIWNATAFRSKIDILTMGPGTRSHMDGGISRRTHGPDEAFHKPSGHIAVQYICDVAKAYLNGDT